MSNDSALSSFEDALGEFKSSVSLVEAPNDWLVANINQINGAVKALPVSPNVETAWLTEARVIYPVCYFTAWSDKLEQAIYSGFLPICMDI